MNSRLGRGLGALIPSTPAQQPGQLGTAVAGAPSSNGLPGSAALATATVGLAEVPGARFAEIDVEKIVPNPKQPRSVFDEDAMAELVHSVQEIGLLQPIVVRRIGDGRYELVMGERRWRATKLAGLTTIPAIVRDTQDDAMLRDALLENLHRSQLNPLEEAAAYQQMLDDFGCTQDVLATRIGRSRPQISNTLRLLKLPASVQRRVAAGVLSAGHARALLGLPSGDAQERLAQRIVAEGLSVRTVEELVALGEAPSPESTPARRLKKPVAPRLTDLADRLSDRFETRVKVDLGKTKGRITVEFASVDDLERIVDLMDPDKKKR
jgi:ParB family chromosome partitioning protein